MARIARRQPQTKIGRRRQQLQLKQVEVAELTGIPVRQLRRLENKEINRVSLAYLVNLAQVLDVDDPLDLAEDEWLEWQVLDARAAAPPDRKHWIKQRPSVKQALSGFSPGSHAALALTDGTRVEGKVRSNDRQEIVVGDHPPIPYQRVKDVLIIVRSPGPE